MSPASESRDSYSEQFEAAPSVPSTPRMKTPKAFMRAVGGFFGGRKSAGSRTSMSSAPSERSWRRTRNDSTSSQSNAREPTLSALHAGHGHGHKEASSPTDPSEMEADDAPPEFVFYGGSEDGTFKPDLRPTDLDRIDHNAIRPSLRQQMPVFFSAPQYENLRRSSLYVDPREYEF